MNLSIWFSAHVVFRRIETVEIGPLTLLVPETASIDLLAAAIAVLAAVLLLRAKIGIGRTLLAGAVMGTISLLPLS